MKLMTKALAAKLPRLYSGENDDDPLVVVHYFNPCGQGDWHIVEGEPREDGDYLLFGLCNLGEPELGYVTLSELAGVRCPPFGLGIERDLHWTPKRLSEVMR